MNKTAITGRMFAMLAATAFSTMVSYALPNPMAWFDMSDVSDGVVRDVSGNGRDLALGSTVEVEEDAVFGKVLVVTGQRSDWCGFSCPVVTNATIAFWLNRDASDSSVMVDAVEKNTYPRIVEGLSGLLVNYVRNNTQLDLVNQRNSPQSAFGGPSPKRQEWHHVAFTVEYVDEGDFGALVGRSYLDGVLVGTVKQANNRAMTPAGISDVTLLNASENGTKPTSGRFADFRFYSERLDDGQIDEIFRSIQVRCLVMRYEFESISETLDANGRHTTPEETGLGSAMSLGSNMTLVDDGVNGKALRFMGTSGIGGILTTPACAIRERTIAMWLRNSSRCTGMHAVVNNPYPRLFNGASGYCQFGTYANLNRTMQFVPAGCGTTSKASTSYAVADIDTWSHLAIVERNGGDGLAKAELYVNGERIESNSEAYDLATLAAGSAMVVGNSSTSLGNRYYCGDIDDFRMYNYALSGDEVRRVYRGVAAVCAGSDFTVAGGVGVLRGRVADDAGDGYRRGYAGESVLWSLVSAPAGGEGASVLQPNAAETSVTLPVAGTYVFRLSVSDLGVARSDDVTVTCVAADPLNAAPTLTASAEAPAITLPDAAVLTAVAQDDGRPSSARTRTSWRKKSGPGGVWFDGIEGAVTKASFGAAGTYVLSCTADDGQATTTVDVAVVVADRSDGKDLSSDLVRYWSLDGQAAPYFVEHVTGSASLTPPNYATLRYVKAKAGNGVRASAYSGSGSYFDSGAPVGEVPLDDPSYASSIPPANDYLTVSAWVYIDPDDENLVGGRICGASVVGQHQSYGLRYNEKLSSSDSINEGGFTLFQRGRSGTTASGAIATKLVHFPAPSPSPVGRWLHICAISSRNNPDSSRFEMWYDGVRQTQVASYGAARGRVRSDPLLIAGMNYTASATGDDGYNNNWKYGDGDECYSRTFPGIVDEVRIWTRKLTPEEIRYLAANPVLDANKGPSVDVPVSTGVNASARIPIDVATMAFADKLPSGGALTYEWSVVSGETADASFEDKTAASTTFTARKKGTYVLQLKVSDGERSVCSRPLSIDVSALGLVIDFR